MTVNVQNNTFRVSNFVPTDSGFEAQLNRAAMLVGALGDQVLNLYDGIDDPDDLPDVTLVGDSVGPVAGSMVWDAATRTMTFVKTGGPLLPDTYRATLVSSADAWQDESGELLDGDSDFVAGGDFVTDFLVGGGLDRVVSVPDFARGAGQAVNLPIMIDNGSGVVSVDVDLFYDPALLNISGALLGADVPAGWNIIPFFPPGEPGRLNLVLFSTSIPLSGANLELVTLIANVPETAPYGGSHVIRLENLELNEDNIGSKADSAIHKAVYLGDANGSASYTGFDAALIAGVAVGANSGFDSFAWTDPVIVGDASGNGAMSSFDAALVAQKAVLLDVDQIPDLPDPAIVLVEVEPGIDPQFSIPVGIPAAPGAEVVVPVSLDLDDVTNLRAADFVLTYDADLLEFVSATHGDLLPAEDSWSFTVNGNEAGVVRISLFNFFGNATGSGVIANVTLRVSPDAAPESELALDIEPKEQGDQGLTWTESDGSLTIRGGPLADLTGNGFVDFEDLTVLLAHWNQDVSAAEGNLADPAGTPVNFEDLTVLLAAWTGPAPAASPQPAAAEAIVPSVASVSEQDTSASERRAATNAHFDRLGRRDHATLRRAGRANGLSSHDAPLRRLQAAAVDGAMGEDSESTPTTRASAFLRRRR